MRVKIIFKNKDLLQFYKLYIAFIRFLQSEYQLNKDILILFVNEREGKMSTGARTDNGTLKVLSKGRLNRDILRTLAHEWIHEYQMTTLNREKGPNIGGKNEDDANAISAKLIKIFEKNYPEKEKFMYE
jgi:hypothetical protein